MTEKATADEYMIEAVDWFEEAVTRFAGVDVQFRRFKPPEWSAPWRATMVASKNERADYRITVYGESFYNAIVNLRAAIEEVDRS